MHTTGQSEKVDNIRLRASGQSCNVIQYHRCGSPRPHEILAFPDRGGATAGFALVEAKGSGFQPKAAMELVLATGDRLQISAGVDPATLRMVLGVLRERA